MRKLALFFAILFVGFVTIAIAMTPTQSRISSYSVALGAGSSDTAVITSFIVTGDSCGLMVESNQDSVGITVLETPVSPSGYAGNTSMDYYNTLLSISDTVQAGFTNNISFSAGTYNHYLYVIVKNNSWASQTVTLNIYKIVWN